MESNTQPSDLERYREETPSPGKMARTMPLLLLALPFCPLNLMAETTAKEQRPIYVKQSACRPPLFVYGSSLLDVGENAAAMPGRSVSEFPPYGVHYFGRTAARFSNGRLLIDFITQGLGYGFVDPFLKSLGSAARNTVRISLARADTQAKVSANPKPQRCNKTPAVRTQTLFQHQEQTRKPKLAPNTKHGELEWLCLSQLWQKHILWLLKLNAAGSVVHPWQRSVRKCRFERALAP